MERAVPAGNDLVCVQPSRIDGLGLFARVGIKAGQRVIEYVGRRIEKSESVRLCSEGNDAIFYLDERYDLDGKMDGNLARYINHSCAPNCVAERIEGRIWITALRPIEAGEELSFDYGYDLEDYREYPCRCGAPSCRGYVVSEELFGRRKAD